MGRADPDAALVAVMIMVSIGTFSWARSPICAAIRRPRRS
jgi:MFS superfamily sulfate permease-like transporter